jgi:hypothetical protein
MPLGSSSDLRESKARAIHADFITPGLASGHNSTPTGLYAHAVWSRVDLDSAISKESNFSNVTFTAPIVQSFYRVKARMKVFFHSVLPPEK